MSLIHHVVYLQDLELDERREKEAGNQEFQGRKGSNTWKVETKFY